MLPARMQPIYRPWCGGSLPLNLLHHQSVLLRNPPPRVAQNVCVRRMTVLLQLLEKNPRIYSLVFFFFFLALGFHVSRFLEDSQRY